MMRPIDQMITGTLQFSLLILIGHFSAFQMSLNFMGKSVTQPGNTSTIISGKLILHKIVPY